MVDIRKIYRLSLFIVRDKVDFIYSYSEFGQLIDFIPIIVDGLSYLKEKFPNKSDSWYARALARALVGVKKVSSNHWLVKGFKYFGDSSSLYNIIQLKDGKYVCDCYSRAFGFYRRGKVCTHIASVILARKMKYNFLDLYMI